jgi:hypothetical protein
VLLEDKHAVIYRDGGKVAGAVARVFLIGRTLESLEEIAPSQTSKDGRDKKRRTYELEACI